MKFLIIFLISFSVYSQSSFWEDLKLDSKYSLSEELTFEEDGSVIAARTKVKLVNIHPLEMINVMLYTFELQDCSALSKSEMHLKGYYSEQNFIEIGYQLDSACTLEVFLELRDFYNLSIFEKTEY